MPNTSTRMIRTTIFALAVASLAACATQKNTVNSGARDAQRYLLSNVGLDNAFATPVHAGLPTVTALPQAQRQAVVIGFDPKHITPEEIDEAGKTYCAKAGSGRQPKIMRLHVRDRNQKRDVDAAGEVHFFCTNGSPDDQQRLATYQEALGQTLSEHAQWEADRRAAEMQAMIGQMRKSRAGWEAMQRRDEQRVLGAGPGYVYTPVK